MGAPRGGAATLQDTFPRTDEAAQSWAAATGGRPAKVAADARRTTLQQAPLLMSSRRMKGACVGIF